MPLHPGSRWLLSNWMELEWADNKWLAASEEGLADVSDTLDELLARLRDQGRPLGQYSVVFLTSDIVQ